MMMKRVRVGVGVKGEKGLLNNARFGRYRFDRTWIDAIMDLSEMYLKR